MIKYRIKKTEKVGGTVEYQAQYIKDNTKPIIAEIIGAVLNLFVVANPHGTLNNVSAAYVLFLGVMFTSLGYIFTNNWTDISCKTPSEEGANLRIKMHKQFEATVDQNRKNDKIKSTTYIKDL